MQYSQLQVTHGGQGPNRTIKHIIAEMETISQPTLVERNFNLSNHT
jgi:hypothetical protein